MFECEYCFKSFKKENTLQKHTCEKKKRFENQNSNETLLAFNLWKIWMKKVQKSNKENISEFLHSRFFKTFYDLADFLIKNYSHSYEEYFDYLIEKNIPTHKWKYPENWNNFIKNLTRNENHFDATSRTIKFIWNWSYQNNINPKEFFYKIGDNHLALLLNQGIISPWVVYCCESGLSKISNMGIEQKSYIVNTMDSDYWFRRFKLRNQEFNTIKDLLAEEGL